MNEKLISISYSTRHGARFAKYNYSNRCEIYKILSLEVNGFIFEMDKWVKTEKKEIYSEKG